MNTKQLTVKIFSWNDYKIFRFILRQRGSQTEMYPKYVKAMCTQYVKAIDIAGTMEVNCDNNWTKCDIVLNFGRPVPSEVPLLGSIFPICTFKMRNLPRTKFAKIQYNITIFRVYVFFSIPTWQSRHLKKIAPCANWENRMQKRTTPWF